MQSHIGRHIFYGMMLASSSILWGCKEIVGMPDWRLDETAACADGSCVCKAEYGDCDHDPSNGCETDLNSREHCGACGRVCFGGGCVDAQCQPYVMAEIHDQPARIEVADADLGIGTYYGVYRVPRPGNPAPHVYQVAYNKPLKGFVAGGGRAFVVSDKLNIDGEIIEIPWDVAPQWSSSIVLPSSAIMFVHLEVGDRCLYVQHNTDLLGFDLQTQQMYPIASDVVLMRGGGCIVYLTNTSRMVYSMDESDGSSGCGTPKLLHTIDSGIDWAAITCDPSTRIPYISITESATSSTQILRLDPNGNAPQLVASPSSNPMQMKVWSGRLSWVEDTTLYRWDGTRDVEIAKGITSGFAVDDMQTYWGGETSLWAVSN